jgi:hypothetical protein
MTDEEQAWAAEVVRDYEEEQEPDEDCLVCGGEGWISGEDLGYDYGWIDPNETYACTSCGGSGRAKDMRWC